MSSNWPRPAGFSISYDVIEAIWLALRDSVDYFLVRAE
jgi:hypothetical protein